MFLRRIFHIFTTLSMQAYSHTHHATERTRQGPLITPAELLQRTHKPLLLVLCFGNPELFPVLHDIGQDGTTQEHHVFSAWGVFDSDFEVLRIAISNDRVG